MYMYECINTILPTATPLIFLNSLTVMVHYELAVIFRTLGKSDLSQTLRKACTTLLDKGSVVRGMENRGERRLPYNMGAHKERFTHGRYTYIHTYIHCT